MYGPVDQISALLGFAERRGPTDIERQDFELVGRHTQGRFKFGLCTVKIAIKSITHGTHGMSLGITGIESKGAHRRFLGEPIAGLRIGTEAGQNRMRVVKFDPGPRQPRIKFDGSCQQPQGFIEIGTVHLLQFLGAQQIEFIGR